ncbi:MAG: PTS fructose transporter subunit IIC [Oscillospiraceae bacterium]|nr:PTS fructose transporter subunit IIC [Oscillospiraceae bacterium]
MSTADMPEKDPVSEKETTDGKESFGKKIYEHLMNGVTNMLPFTVAGGLFIAFSFLIDTIAGMPQDADFGTHTAVSAFFKTIGGFSFDFMIPVLGAYIGKSIADRPGFLVGLIGGYLASTGSTFASIAGDVPSGFLGALLAGFVGGYIMIGIQKLCEHIPKALDGIKPVLIYPLAGLGIIAVIMCAVNPVMGVINTAVSGFLNSMGGSSKIVLGCLLGGMMSIDMGGPLNKAAYVFAAAGVTAGNYNMMASVMLGGMIPPIAIALSTIFFKNRWTEEERKNGAVNLIMGLSFVTEGAIPYAASDPLRVIPSCFVGAAAAGGLSMAFDCTLMAPHGGIFVFAVAGNWAMYLLSLAAGSIIGMLMLALLKKKKTAE